MPNDVMTELRRVTESLTTVNNAVSGLTYVSGKVQAVMSGTVIVDKTRVKIYYT